MGKQNRIRTILYQKVRIKISYQTVISGSIVIGIAFVFTLVYLNLSSPSKTFAALGMHGAKTVSTTNSILNEFTTLSSNASAGATSISVASSSLNANSRFSGNLSAGELVMIIQMQGATMKTWNKNSSGWGADSLYNNAGKVEFDEVASVPNSTTINLVSPLINSYTSSGKVQVVRVPRYSSFTINAGASVTTDDWDGSKGGIVAIEVKGTTTINGTVDVTGKGFRGGNVQHNSTCCPGNHSAFATTVSAQGGEKGEGIGGSQATYDALGGRYGRGAPMNGGGGGNSHNAAGGGGANAGAIAAWNGLGIPDTITSPNWKTAWDLESANFHKNISTGGGRGGYTYSQATKNPITTGPNNGLWSGDSRYNTGGYGGRPLDNSGNRIFMGGGGGAGDSNDGTGSGGGDGGGIVYLLSGNIVTGSGTINANGANAPNSISVSDGDGSGGGGGGGTVYIYTQGASISNLTINAKGGNGGNQVINGLQEGEGAGGGGGGGYISTTNATSLNRSVAGGKYGTTDSGPFVTFLPNGATGGAAGTIGLNPPNPYTGVVALPVLLKSFTAEKKSNCIELNWITVSEINCDYFTVERSADGYDYYEIARVHGAGNSTVERSYRMSDDSPLTGDGYYRLSQTDYNGVTEKFNPVHINGASRDEGFHISYFGPNPFEDNLRVDFHSEEAGVVEIRLVNSKGQTVRSEQIITDSGMNSFIFGGLSSLTKGIYFIQLLQEDAKTPAVKVLKD